MQKICLLVVQKSTSKFIDVSKIISLYFIIYTYLFKQVSNTAPPMDSYTTSTPCFKEKKNSHFLVAVIQEKELTNKKMGNKKWMIKAQKTKLVKNKLSAYFKIIKIWLLEYISCLKVISTIKLCSCFHDCILSLMHDQISASTFQVT